MALTATLSARFKITVPKELRDSRNWRPGQKFAFLPKNGGVMLVPVPELDDLLGIAKGADKNHRDRNDRY